MDKTYFSGLSIQILGNLIHFNLGGFFLYVFFSKEPFKYLELLWIQSTAPMNEHSKTDVPKFETSQEKFREWRLFPPSKFDPATGVTPWYTSVAKYVLVHIRTYIHRTYVCRSTHTHIHTHIFSLRSSGTSDLGTWTPVLTMSVYMYVYI